MNGNEPAFPSTQETIDQNVARNFVGPIGMDLRTYLAAKALTGLLGSNMFVHDLLAAIADKSDQRVLFERIVATRAVRLADALIEALSREFPKGTT